MTTTVNLMAKPIDIVYGSHRNTGLIGNTQRSAACWLIKTQHQYTHTHTVTLTLTHTRAARASKGKRDANRICQRHFPSTVFHIFFALFVPFAAAFLLLIVVVTLVVVVVFCLIENVLYVICLCRLRIRTACGYERSLVMLL